MSNTIYRLVLRGIFTLWLAISATFFVMRGFSGNVLIAEYQQAGLTEADIQGRLSQFDLDRPIFEQYILYLHRFLMGDFGQSLYRSQPIQDMIINRLPSTLWVAGLTMLLSVPIGIVIGIHAGTQPFWGRISSFIAKLSLSIPVYWSATVVLFIISGFKISFQQDSLWLILGVLVFHVSGGIAYVVEKDIEMVLSADFIRTARAKGLSERTVLLHHAFKNIAPAIARLSGIQFGFLIGNTVVVEVIFLRSGIGYLLVESVLNRDYNVVQAIVAIMTFCYFMVNLATEIVAVFFNPRLGKSEIF